MTTKINKLKSNIGFTVVEMTVAAGIVAATFTGTLAAMKATQKAKAQSQNLDQVGDVQPMLIKGVNNVVLNVKNISTQKNTEALCKLMSLRSGTSVSSGAQGGSVSVLSEIVVRLTDNEVKAALPDQRWLTAFPKWKIVDPKTCVTPCEEGADSKNCSKAPGPFVRCMEPDLESLAADQKLVFSKLKPLVEVSITPLALYPKVEVFPVGATKPVEVTIPMFSAIPKTAREVDAKRVLFELSSRLTYSPAGAESSIRKTDKQLQYVWPGDVGYCDTTINNASFKLSPASTGEGDSTGKMLYNTPAFKKGTKPPLQVIPRKKQIQAGLVEGGRIQTDPQKNIEASCNEVKFQCRNDSSTPRTFNPSFYLDYTLKYDSSFSKDSNSAPVVATRIIPKLSIRQDQDLITQSHASATNADVLSENGAQVDYRLGAFPFLKTPGGRYVNAITGQEMVVTKKHNLRMLVTNAQNACRQICSRDNFQNLPYKPRLFYSLLDVRDPSNQSGSYESEYLATNSLGCTACYTKNCTRFGVGTFGPMKDQPDEPLDSSLPECAIKNPSNLAQPIPMHATTVSVSSDSCIAGSVDSVSGTIQFSSRDCNERLPVLCFNYGRFFLAKTNSASSSTFSTHSFSEAPLRCYHTSHETISRRKITGMFDQQNREPARRAHLTDIPESFNNNAHQGFFLAPQTTEQIKNAAESIKTQTFGSGYFWVAYKSDSDATLVANKPVFPKSTLPADQFALFFDKEGKVSLTRHPASMPALVAEPNSSNSAGGVGGYILTHHLRYRGLIPAGTTQSPSKKFEFLCQKREAPYFFATTGKASNKQSDGVAACEASGGIFLPPTTPLGWAKAITVVEEPDPEYPFPDPEQPGVDALWVGLNTDDTLVDFLQIKTAPISKLEAPQKVMCEMSDGYFKAYQYNNEGAQKGCPEGAKLVKLQIGKIPGIASQIRWRLSGESWDPGSGVFYVAP